MATMDTSQVTVGAGKVTGAIFVAATTVALPTDATTALASGFALLGYTSDAGVQISEESERASIRAWEGRTEVYNAVNEYTEKISFTPIQCNGDVAKLTWGNDAVTVSSGALVAHHHGNPLDPVHIVIETTPRTGIVKRYCGKFQLTERGEQTLNGTDPDGRPLTFNAIGDANGYTMHEYTAFTTGGN